MQPPTPPDKKRGLNQVQTLDFRAKSVLQCRGSHVVACLHEYSVFTTHSLCKHPREELI